jgi:HSP20 family protein
MLGMMNHVDQDLLSQFERMRAQMDRVFGATGEAMGIRSVAAGTYPAVNVAASPEQVDVYVFAAGMDPEKLDVSLQQNLLTVSGERKVELPENVQPYRRERFSGRFRRVMTLPEDVDPDKVEATYVDGILHITVQRIESSRPRKITVK